MRWHVVVDIDINGTGYQHGIRIGDTIFRINNIEIQDVFDYQYILQTSSSVIVEYISKDGIPNEVIIKNNGQDLGLGFENKLMDQYKKCKNNCIFCFVGQLPCQLKQRLSLKEDDCRKSFFPWNRYDAYCTLIDTPMEEIDRYIKYGLNPVNVSVHSSEPDIREKIFRNPNARNTLDKMKILYRAGIEMNALIVLCPGINDGIHLERTLNDLFEFAPVLRTVAIGPVGLTKYRKNAELVKSFSEQDAKKALQTIEKYQKLAQEKYNILFAQGSDLLYFLAGQTVPDESGYDSGLFRQFGNGVGMVRHYVNEFEKELETAPKIYKKREISIATGVAFYPIMQTLVQAFKNIAPNITVHLYEIHNKFFGGDVVVAGLISAEDLVEQLKNKRLGSELLLSSEMIGGSGKFIDGVKIETVEKQLNVKLNFDTKSGDKLLRTMIGE